MDKETKIKLIELAIQKTENDATDYTTFQWIYFFELYLGSFTKEALSALEVQQTINYFKNRY